MDFPDLTLLDTDLVAQQQLEAATRLQEAFPELDLKRGVYHDTVLYFHSLLSSGIQTMLAQYLASRSLLAIEANPELADTETTDEVLSNWGITRSSGTTASGTIAILLSAATNVTIAAGASFSANGMTFATTQVFAAKTNEALISSSSDRLIVPTSDGYYSFTIEVTANAVGSKYNLVKDTHVVPLSQPTNFVSSYVVSDFTGGSDEETNTDLVTRLQQGIAARGFASTPTNMDALLRSIPEFAITQVTSVVGMGDPEMLRDRHSLFPISYGGRIDWYVRTQPKLRHGTLAKTAVLVEKDSDGYGIWQFSVGKSEAAGFYEFRNIKLASNSTALSGYEVVEDIRGVDLTDSTILPDIASVSEGAYTAFQTATIRFKDTDTAVTSLDLGATQDYSVEVVLMPGLKPMQETMGGYEYRCRTADVLVKAPVPCFVQLTTTLHKRADDTDPDLDAIKTALAALVNGVTFVGVLYASQLFDVIHTYLTGKISAGAMDMLGRIRRPDGTTLYLRDPSVLQVPDEPESMVTAKTVQFFLDVEDITINVETDIPMPI